MEFVKYQHIERFGTVEVDGITVGHCLLFPKLDGTNSSLWLDNDDLIAGGSRNRTLALDNDNAGFLTAMLQDEGIKGYFAKHPIHRLYGEWLVPHTLKTYRDSAWRKFWIFDVAVQKSTEHTCDGWAPDDLAVRMELKESCLACQEELIPYNTYRAWLDEFELDYIQPLAEATSPSYDQLCVCLDKNTFLVKDGQGTGEGIVVKNYDYYNKFGRQTWAKIVRTEFKEMNYKEFGTPTIKGEKFVEDDICTIYCNQTLVDKTYAKIVTAEDGWSSKFIPRLFGEVYYDIVNEEIWGIVKKYKQPKIDFKLLNALCIRKIKELKPEIFS